MQSPVGVRAGASFASSALGPADQPVRSLYIHIPFCFHKCHYCDFYSIVDRQDRQEPFTERLCDELRALAPWAAGKPLKTIFVGGGTPSLLRPVLWRRLLRCLADSYDLSQMGRSGEGEFTVECNPETVTPELMDVLAAGGATRVSLGAQSFEKSHLKTLERWHEPENVGRAVELARRAGIGRQSVDLIFGIPGQSVTEWRSDLQAALSLGTEHLSCYDLTYEPGTAMTKRLALGQFTPADEEVEVEMFGVTPQTLRGAGLERYEVSNYARPGAECRHNLAYWRQDQWLAAGPSASAHVGGHRWKNVPRLDDYLTLSDRGFAPITDHEPPDPARALSERIMTGLRLAEGVRVGALLDGLNAELVRRLSQIARDYERRGLLSSVGSQGTPERDAKGARWVLTDAGFLMADAIAADLMAAIRD